MFDSPAAPEKQRVVCPKTDNSPITANKPLADPDVMHRVRCKQFATEDAPERYREMLRPIHEHWDGLNEGLFDGGLNPPHIEMSNPTSTHAFGDYSSMTGEGSRCLIRIRPSVWDGTHECVREGDEFEEGRFRFICDIVLHETVHQYLDEVANIGQSEKAYDGGHGPRFRDEANRIGRLLGLPMVRNCKKRGRDKDLLSCSHWPHNTRPAGYYLGAFVPRDADDEGKHRSKHKARLRSLHEWLQAVPGRRESLDLIGETFFLALDTFLEEQQASTEIRGQAITQLAKCYRERLKRLSKQGSEIEYPGAIVQQHSGMCEKVTA